MDCDLVFGLILGEKVLQPSVGRRHSAVNYTQIIFFQLAVLDLLVHDAQSLGGLGGDDDAAGVPVNTVAQGGGKGVLGPGVPLLFLVEIGLDMGNEGIDVLVFVGVDHQTGPLVHQQDVLVLV